MQISCVTIGYVIAYTLARYIVVVRKCFNLHTQVKVKTIREMAWHRCNLIFRPLSVSKLSCRWCQRRKYDWKRERESFCRYAKKVTRKKFSFAHALLGISVFCSSYSLPLCLISPSTKLVAYYNTSLGAFFVCFFSSISRCTSQDENQIVCLSVRRRESMLLATGENAAWGTPGAPWLSNGQLEKIIMVNRADHRLLSWRTLCQMKTFKSFRIFTTSGESVRPTQSHNRSFACIEQNNEIETLSSQRKRLEEKARAREIYIPKICVPVWETERRRTLLALIECKVKGSEMLLCVLCCSFMLSWSQQQY